MSEKPEWMMNQGCRACYCYVKYQVNHPRVIHMIQPSPWKTWSSMKNVSISPPIFISSKKILIILRLNEIENLQFFWILIYCCKLFVVSYWILWYFPRHFAFCGSGFACFWQKLERPSISVICLKILKFYKTTK